MDYARFGDKIVQRPDRNDPNVEWVEVPPDDYAIAEAALEAEAARNDDAAGAPDPIRVVRAQQNEEIAAKLGLNADELAERLSDPRANAGTRVRVDDAEFDALMAQLGLSPEEARARFKGTHSG